MRSLSVLQLSPPSTMETHGKKDAVQIGPMISCMHATMDRIEGIRGDGSREKDSEVCKERQRVETASRTRHCTAESIINRHMLNEHGQWNEIETNNRSEIEGNNERELVSSIGH